MERIHFLLLNFRRLTCRQGNCGKFIELLENCFPHAHFHQCMGEKGLTLLRSLGRVPDVIFLPLGSKGIDVHELRRMRKEWPDVRLLGVVCDYSTTIGLNNGTPVTIVDDFFCCPVTPVDIQLRVTRHLKKGQRISEATGNGLQENPYAQDGLIGESFVFRKALEELSVLAKTEVPVLIVGETGTGKELIARAIHYHGPRQGKPFIPVNCGALPDHLFENELFGHTKGAYTDASAEQKGLTQEAEGGTLFLDEIDTLSRMAQVKLLRFLQDQEYRPLGASKTSKANVRVLIATNKDLQSLVHDEKFREDLYYRINVFPLWLPPLRARSEDIPVLANHFLAQYAPKSSKQPGSFSRKSLESLIAYHWPGNVRELESCIRRAVILNSTGIIESTDLHLPAAENERSRVNSFHAAKSKIVENFEQNYLTNLLILHKGNVSKAAKAAGKERRTFQRLLHKYGIDKTKYLTLSSCINPSVLSGQMPQPQSA